MIYFQVSNLNGMFLQGDSVKLWASALDPVCLNSAHSLSLGAQTTHNTRNIPENNKEVKERSFIENKSIFSGSLSFTKGIFLQIESSGPRSIRPQ